VSLGLDALKQDGYRIGDLQAVGYLRTDPMFEEGYLGKIYGMLKGNRYSDRDGLGIIESLFFGMDPSWDNIVSYLSKTPLIIMGVWQPDDSFKPAGILFRTVVIGGGRSCMAGYAFFREFWGKPEAEVLGMLGLAFAFQEFRVEAIHGMRYADNRQTVKFSQKYGFRDIGVHPRWELRRGELVDAVSSCLLKEDFEAYVDNMLAAAYGK
jgi:hypothetical protein